MRKFDTLIASYLYRNKKMSLEGIGHFSLDENFVVPPDTDKAAFYPLEGIRFIQDNRAETSPGLIDFLADETGKIKSLVRADFASYISEVRQFVNIGKPSVIEGIGTLHKNKEGFYELVPGQVLSERVNMHYVEQPDTTEEPVKKKKWLVGFILTIAVLVVIVGLGFGVYVLFIKTQDTVPEQEATFTLPEDTSTAIISTDTLPASDSLTIAPPVTDGRYRVVFETTPRRQRAVTRTTQLKEFGVDAQFDSMVVNNVMYYRMFIFKDIRPEDTTRIKDSLSMYFGRRVSLQ